MTWIDNLSPGMNMLGAGDCRSEGTRPLENAPDFLLFFIISGSCRIAAGNADGLYGEGDWLFIPPNTTMRFSGPSEDFSARWINFHCRGSGGGTECVPEDIAYGNIGEEYEIWMNLEIMQRRWHSGDVREVMTCRALFLEILIRLFADYPEDHDAPATETDEPQPVSEEIPEEQLALMIKRLLDELPPNQYSISEMMTGMNFSYEYIEGIFYKYYHCSPLEYLMKLRVAQSAKKIGAAGKFTADNVHNTSLGGAMRRVEHEGGYYSYEIEPSGGSGSGAFR